jgi:hypothetical protein
MGRTRSVRSERAWSRLAAPRGAIVAPRGVVFSAPSASPGSARGRRLDYRAGDGVVDALLKSRTAVAVVPR